MSIVHIFSPFYWKKNMGGDHQYIKERFLELMLDNYRKSPVVSPDWNIHTSYKSGNLLSNKIDWNISIPIYTKYINEFLLEYFGKQVEWGFSGIPWYNVYGSNQTACTHEHIPDVFSIVHYLKFDPNKHWPISFINPQGSTTKYILALYPELKDAIDFSNQNQSLFHPRFTPITNEGDLIIFPSHLEHLVEKVSSQDLRISIAMNIKIKSDIN